MAYFEVDIDLYDVFDALCEEFDQLKTGQIETLTKLINEKKGIGNQIALMSILLDKDLTLADQIKFIYFIDNFDNITLNNLEEI